MEDLLSSGILTKKEYDTLMMAVCTCDIKGSLPWKRYSRTCMAAGYVSGRLAVCDVIVCIDQTLQPKKEKPRPDSPNYHKDFETEMPKLSRPIFAFLMLNTHIEEQFEMRRCATLICTI